MNTLTSTVVAVVALSGSISFAAGVDDPRVRVTEFPVGVDGWYGIEFSDDGSSVAVVTDYFVAPRVLVNRGHGWELAMAFGAESLGQVYLTGFSDDGSSVAFFDRGQSYLYRDGVTQRLPSVWIGADGQSVLKGPARATAISGDGLTVGFSGGSADLGSYTLVWGGGELLTNLDLAAPFSGVRNAINAIDADGDCLAITSSYYGRVGDFRWLFGPKDAWHYDAAVDELTPIPEPVRPYATVPSVVGISDDGQTVLGISSVLVGGPSVLSGPYISTPLHRAEIGWVWSPDSGLVELGPGEFDRIVPRDMSADGSVVVGYGTIGAEAQPVVWTPEAGTRSVADLMTNLNIDFDPRYMNLAGISDDGTMLLGEYYLDERWVLVTVTLEP